MVQIIDMNENRNEIERILAGEAGAFQAFVTKYQRLVSHIVFRMVTNESDRQDLCQDVFMKIHQNLASFRRESKVSTWVARIAHNHCLNFLEKKKVPLFDDLTENERSVDGVVGPAPTPAQCAERNDLATRLRHEIDQLPPQYRTIVTLYHLDDMSYREIGKVTGLPDGTVKSYLFRARKALKERLISRFSPEDLDGFLEAS